MPPDKARAAPPPGRAARHDPHQAQSAESLFAVQFTYVRARRAAAQRLAPLADGVRDPLDSLAGHEIVPRQWGSYDVVDLGLTCAHGADCPARVQERERE